MKFEKYLSKQDWIQKHLLQILDWESELNDYASGFHVGAIFYIGPWGEINRRYILTNDYTECVLWLATVAPTYKDENCLIYFNQSMTKFSIKDNKLYDEHLKEFVNYKY